MEKRKVTVRIGGQPCSFYSDDPDEYLASLTERANQTIEQFSGMNAKAILFLTDALMREEEKQKTEQGEEKAELKAEAKPEPKRIRKSAPAVPADNHHQVTVWDLVQAARDPAEDGES